MDKSYSPLYQIPTIPDGDVKKVPAYAMSIWKIHTWLNKQEVDQENTWPEASRVKEKNNWTRFIVTTVK